MKNKSMPWTGFVGALDIIIVALRVMIAKPTPDPMAMAFYADMAVMALVGIGLICWAILSVITRE